MERKLIAVVGATGLQGGGLVRAITSDTTGAFKVRALTRDPKSAKAQDLARLGAEVVAANLDDEKSLIEAFRGAYGAFCVTNFWEHFSPAREYTQAKNQAQAAKAAGVQHAVWSTLEDTRRWVPVEDNRLPTLMGSYKVPHFDAKGEADAAFRDLNVPTTFLLTSFYWDNLILFGMGPKPGADGTLAMAFPMGDKKLPGIAAEDIGGCVYGIFRSGASYIGKTVGLAGQHLTGAEMAAALTRALGRTVRYHAVTPEQYRAFGFPGADDLANMFQFKRDFQDVFCGARDPAVAKALNPGLQSFDAWLGRHASRIPLS